MQTCAPTQVPVEARGSFGCLLLTVIVETASLTEPGAQQLATMDGYGAPGSLHLSLREVVFQAASPSFLYEYQESESMSSLTPLSPLPAQNVCICRPRSFTCRNLSEKQSRINKKYFIIFY